MTFPTRSRTTGLLLAAGAGRRYGHPKALLEDERGPWVVRAARDFDGWVASAAKRSDADVAEAMARYRAAGGTGRTVVTNIRASAGPELDSRAEGGWLDALAARLGHYAQLGFDDAVVVLPPGDERLDEVRALVS